jgi:hypothetical protein
VDSWCDLWIVLLRCIWCRQNIGASLAPVPALFG